MPETVAAEIGSEVWDREHEFYDTFGGEKFFEFGYIRIVERVADILSILFGDEIAKRGLDQIVNAAFKQNTHRHHWRDLLEEEFNGIYSETAFGAVLHDLTAYGEYGIVSMPGPDVEKREKVLKGQIAHAMRLIELVPAERWELTTEHLVHVVEMAAARWKLDHDEPVNARELSLLSGRALQTIYNLLSGNKIVGNRDRIAASDALGWLRGQYGFRSSLWRQQHDDFMPQEIMRHVEDALFVPVSSDGTVFHPGLRREGVYVLDGGTGEMSLDDFDAALAELQRMRFPQWRRPTPGGSWTWVRGVEWRRVSREELLPDEPVPAD